MIIDNKQKDTNMKKEQIITFDEYEPPQGWRRFQEELNTPKMDAADVVRAVAIAVLILAAYVLVGTMEAI